MRLHPKQGKEILLKQQKKTPLQWHPAFYAGIQIEFAKEADYLIFENEHHLGTKPKEIDVLIIKKDSNIAIQKNIGRIFRTHNIIEYKSPDDYLSIDDFYLVYAYACLYKSDTPHIDEISAEEITISFVSKSLPCGLIKHLKKVRNYRIQKIENGIYYVKGDFFPIQFICTKELSDEQNLWLHNLRNNITEKHVIENLFYEYQQHANEKLYASIMNIITKANREKVKEVTGMCEALAEIYLELHGERLQREQQEAIDKGIAEGLSKAVAEAVDEAVAEAVDEAVAKAVDKAVAKAVAEAVAEKDAALAKSNAYIKELEAKLALQN